MSIISLNLSFIVRKEAAEFGDILEFKVPEFQIVNYLTRFCGKSVV